MTTFDFNMKQIIYRYLNQHPPALELFQGLEQAGDLYLIGGVLREFLDHKDLHKLRDIDIIIDVKRPQQWKNTLEKYLLRSNRFGGNKLICDGLLVDTWPIEQTWAFRENIVECSPEEYVEKLPDTVFLNIDGIIFDWKHEKWNRSRYEEAMSSRILDVVLVDNPQIPLNIVRAFGLRKRYNMNFSENLVQVILAEYKRYQYIAQFLDLLMCEQQRRYKQDILSRAQLAAELDKLLISGS